MEFPAIRLMLLNYIAARHLTDTIAADDSAVLSLRLLLGMHLSH